MTVEVCAIVALLCGAAWALVWLVQPSAENTLRHRMPPSLQRQPEAADTALSNLLSAALMDDALGDVVAVPLIARRNPATAAIEIIVGSNPAAAYVVVGNRLTPIAEIVDRG
ncbi:hypothetical protein [Segnochrobactrum spirostomi]|uniref:hypothetical protein n=1 Tax=Segnochrobactrum spirostomi TaxID=2608987 RepID=UPI001AD82EB0|nr:hypothetical protein [Segnochrobactrum spirostomi]